MSKFYPQYTTCTLAAVSLILFCLIVCLRRLPVALHSYFTILPQDLHLDRCHLSRHLPQSRRTRLKLIRLEKGAILEARWWDMRASVHVCIHRSVVELVQLQHLVSGEIKKSHMLRPLLPWLKLMCLAKWNLAKFDTISAWIKIYTYSLLSHPMTCTG